MPSAASFLNRLDVRKGIDQIVVVRVLTIFAKISLGSNAIHI